MPSSHDARPWQAALSSTAHSIQPAQLQQISAQEEQEIIDAQVDGGETQVLCYTSATTMGIPAGSRALVLSFCATVPLVRSGC